MIISLERFHWKQSWWLIFWRIPMTHIHGGPRTDPSELQGKKTDIFHVSTVVSVILNHSQCFLTHHPRQPEKKEEKRGTFSFCLAPQWQCLDSQLQQMCCPRVRCGANSGFMMQPTDSSVKVAVHWTGLKPWRFMTMKIGKTGNTLNDTQPQQIYGCIIATHHLGEKSSSNPAESPIFQRQFGVKSEESNKQIGAEALQK